MRVVQCWDDGIVDDVRLTDLLRKYGAKATFNLNYGVHRSIRFHSWDYQDSKPIWILSQQELRSVYQGFLIGNHSLSHPWLGRLSVEEMKREIIEGKERLEQHFGAPIRGFAYPFGEFNQAVKDAVRESNHLYGRTALNGIVAFPLTDPFELKPDCPGCAPDFWERYQSAKERDADGKAIFYFWGRSYQFSSEQGWKDLEDKMARIAADPDAVWTDLPALWAPGGGPSESRAGISPLPPQ